MGRRKNMVYSSPISQIFEGRYCLDGNATVSRDTTAAELANLGGLRLSSCQSAGVTVSDPSLLEMMKPQFGGQPEAAAFTPAGWTVTEGGVTFTTKITGVFTK